MAIAVISGTARWAKLNEKNRDFYDDKDVYGSYTLDLFPSEEEAAKYEKMGALVKRDKDTGAPFFRLKRPHAIEYDVKDKETGKKTGESTVWELGPPQVLDENLEPIDVLIGNESPVNVEVELRNYGPKNKKLSMRIEKVQVDTRTLVRYEGKGLKKIVAPTTGGSYNSGASAIGGETM